MDGGETSHEEIELKSPFPVIPPVKDSKWNELPSTPDGQSQPLEPPKLFPDIGEPHPCPYFVGPDLNFAQPGRKKKKPPPAVIPPPVIPPPPPVIPTPPLPVPVPPPPVISPPPPPEPGVTDEENEVIDTCLEECVHGVIWECIAEQGNDMTREMFCALVSSNPKKYILDKPTLDVLWRKISKKTNADNWTEPCEPIDRLKIDVLNSQAYKLFKSRYTVTNEGISDFHRRTVSQTTSNNLVNLYSSDMEKKLKKQDAKDFKVQPPRVASWIGV